MIIQCGLVTHSVLCAMHGKQVEKKRNVHQPRERLGLHDQSTMLAGAISDEKEEAKQPNEKRR